MTTKDEATDTSVQTNEQADVTQAVADEKVSKADHERVLKDMHKFKNIAKEAETKLKTIEEQKLKDTENWKQYAELKEKEAREAIEKAEQVQTSYISEKKFSAVKEAAIKSGIHPKALEDLELLDLSAVVLETTSTGRLNVLGADNFISNLKAMKPHWFGGTKTNIHSDIPGTTSSSPKTAREIAEMGKTARKTGDYTAYKAELEKFRQQQR